MSKIIVNTPVGTVKWFNLHKEDKFGNFTCDLELEDTPEMHKFKDQIDSLAPEGRKPYKAGLNGGIVVKLKLKAKGQKKDGTSYNNVPPVIYNMNKEKLSIADVIASNIGNGSTIMAKVELSAYDFNGLGVSCKPKAILVKKIEQFSGGEMGFDDSEFDDIDAGEEVPTSTPQTSSDF